MALDPRLKELLNRWENLCEAGQTPTAEEHCREWPEMVGEFRELLRRYEVIDAIPDERAAVTRPPEMADATGQPVHYRVEGDVGGGGMGVVLAARDEQLGRSVALKFPHQGEGGRYFRREIAITARLQHPGIVPVYGSAIGNDGRPGYAMRFVEGESFAAAINRHHSTDSPESAKPTRAELIDRFESICNTMAYAHSQGVIHRDLKPANIMLGKYGETFVVDWGLAKDLRSHGRETDIAYDRATQSDSPGSTVVTQDETGQVMGTPAYMPPEQASGNSKHVDERADVFALGGILYKILTGKTPYGGKELRHEKRETELADTIGRLKQSNADSELIALACWCLNSDLSNRPRNAQDVQDAVRAYKAGLENRAREERERRVAAETKTAEERKRRRVLAGLAASMLLLVILVGVGLLVVNRERRKTVKERDDKGKALVAETKARASEKQAREHAMMALRDMTDDIVESQMARAPYMTEENKEFLRKIIQHFQGFAAMAGDDADTRSIRAEGVFRVGVIRFRLGELKEAETAFYDVLAVWKQRAADLPTRPEFRQDLAIVHNNLGLLLSATGRLKEAETAHGEALAIRKQLADELPLSSEVRRELAMCHHDLGMLLIRTGRIKQAELAYGEALALQKQLAAGYPTRPEFRQDLAMVQTNIGLLFSATGRLKEAEAAYGEALTIRKKLANDFPTRPEYREGLAISHSTLGNHLGGTGRLKEAEVAHGEALAIWKQLAAEFPIRPEFRKELALGLNDMALLFRATGRVKEAEAALGEALVIGKRLAADFPTSPEYRQGLAMTHDNLGVLLRFTGRNTDAAATCREALTIRKKLAADFPNRIEFRQALAGSYNNLGNLLNDNGQLTEAEASYAEALAIQKELAAAFPNLSDLRNELAGSLVNLGALRNQRRDFQGAKAHLEQAQEHHEAALKANPQHPTYRHFHLLSLYNLAKANTGLMDQVGAVNVARRCRDLGWNPPIDAYTAARVLAQCVAIVGQHEKLSMEERTIQMRFYGDHAMGMLRDAVANGYRDAAQIKNDADLAPLRLREDFQSLLKELETRLQSNEKM